MNNIFFINNESKIVYLQHGYIPSIEECKLIRSYLNNVIKKGETWINDRNKLVEKALFLEITQRSPKIEKPTIFEEIYIASDIGHNYLKIGWSVNPENREKTLQAQKPTIKIIRSFKNATRGQEKRVHKLLSVFRKRGEWFNITLEEAEKAINQILNK
jgi:hypothetical protein